MVPLGLRIACRRASWPTRRSPSSVNATTDGVVREPSALGITVGWPPSMVAITEFVVPRSMPTALAMTFPPHLVAYDRWRATTAPPGPYRPRLAEPAARHAAVGRGPSAGAPRQRAGPAAG